MAGPLRSFLRLLGQALSLALWRRPRSRPELLGFGTFIASCAVSLALYAVQDFHNTPKPAELFGDGFHLHASYWLVALAAGWLGARVLQRPPLWLSLASLLVLVGIPWTALSVQLGEWLAEANELQLDAWRILLAFGGALATLRLIGFLSPATPPTRRFAAGLLCLVVLAWPWYWQQSAWLWYPPEDEQQEQPQPEDDAPEESAAAPGFDAEQVMAKQPELLERRARELRAQTPGKVDLFALGFAGDGSEAVFRNEVEYFGRLMAGRFGAEGRTLELINSEATLADKPLASVSNLRTGLERIAGRMDVDEDILLLFLTSHGSEDHHLLVDLDPLPLDQVDPATLRAALDDAGVRWRVIVVSACYSGGFVDALRDAHTLVITAARADRTSFGCGNDSRVTWFGKAFLTQALNQTTDFRQAFALASRQVREWELAEGNTPSVPQMQEGAAIAAKLGEWRATLPSTPAVPFEPAAAPAQGAASSSR